MKKLSIIILAFICSCSNKKQPVCTNPALVVNVADYGYNPKEYGSSPSNKIAIDKAFKVATDNGGGTIFFPNSK